MGLSMFRFKKKNNKNLVSYKYTIDNPRFEKYIIGKYTYGEPKIYDWNQGTNLRIGKFCSFAADVKIFLGGNHRHDWVTTYPFNKLYENFPNGINIFGHPSSNGDVVIGNDVWVGNGACILSGVKIGDGAVIGANTLVSKNIGSYEIWGGNPARFIKKRFSDNIINKLLMLKWWDLNDELINDLIPYLCSDNVNELIIHLEKIRLNVK
jgi:virginiamycin A acetyltransferase